MSLLVVGLTHRTAPLSLLETVVVDESSRADFLQSLLASDSVTEAMILSTCNRVEVYAAVDRFHSGVSAVSEAFARHCGVDQTVFGPHLLVRWDQEAVEHIFRVASGLDSVAVGESQVLGQLRTSYEAAVAASTVGSELHDVVQQGLRVAKRVHTETSVGGAGISLVTVGLAHAEARLGSLAGKRALVVGTGVMGSLAARRLRSSDVAEVAASGRTPESARRLSSALCRRHVPLAEIERYLATFDVVVTAVGGSEPTIRAEQAAAAVERRGGRELVIVDLGMPHNVDPEVGRLPGVHLVDLQTMSTQASGAPPAVAEATALIDEAVQAFVVSRRATSAAPTIVALRAQADQVVEGELARLRGRLDVDEATWRELERTVRRVSDKLLHTPTVRVKELAGEPDGSDYARVLRELFALDSAVVKP